MTVDTQEFRLADDQLVWAFTRSYFEWFMPELFTVSEWRTYLSFSVLYHTHDFFPELPSDVLLSGKPVNVVSPLRGAHRRLKKRPVSASFYGHHTTRAARPNLWRKAAKRSSSHQAKYTRTSGPRSDDGTGFVVTSADCISAAKYMLPGILSKEFLAAKFKVRSSRAICFSHICPFSCEKQDGEETRIRVQTMVERIRDRFVWNLEHTAWLDNATRTAQVAKVRAIVPRVVHPTDWTEETFPLGKEMDPTRYLRNLAIIQEERVRRNLALWSETNYGAQCDARCRDRITVFGSPLFTVNAW